MKDLSMKYALSRIYTNHSIRVTGATILSRKKYSCSQIKEVTGHKSVSSLAVYQRVSDEEKLQMGKSLTDKTLGTERSSTSSRPSTTKPKPEVSFEDVSSQERSDIENLFASAPLEVVVSGIQPSQGLLSQSSHQAQSPMRATLQPIDLNLSPYFRDLEMDPEFDPEFEF